MQKCPSCRKHRIRTKRTSPEGFTWTATKVKYCIGCGWEKVVAEAERTEPGRIAGLGWVAEKQA